MIARTLMAVGVWARTKFDGVPAKLGGVSVVVVLAGLTAGVIAGQSRLLERQCQPLPVSVARLEVTFSTARFQTLLRAEGDCAGDVLRSLVSWDLAFPAVYGFLLAALYLWSTRWRRFGTNDKPLNGVSQRRDLVATLPLVAAGFDAIVENLPLWYAGHVLLPPDSSAAWPATLAVMIGSTGALLKWILLLIVSGAILIELGAGPRGAVLWRVRFSALAAVLGAVPLLAVPQGQDILQRLFEGDHPFLALAAAVPPLILSTIAIWFCARRILELHLPGTSAPPPSDGWYEFFAEQIPRALGVAFLGIVGAAFANAGLAGPRFLAVAGSSFLLALLIRRYLSKPIGVLGRPFLPRGWRDIKGFDERLGRLIVAGGLGVFIFWPTPDRFSLFQQEDAAARATVVSLRVAAYLCAMAAWMFQLYVRYRREAGRLPPKPEVNTALLTSGLTRTFYVAVGITLTSLAAFTFESVAVGRALGPLWILALAASTAVFFGTASIWIGRRFRIPLATTAIALAFLFSSWNDSHVVRPSPEATALGRKTIAAELKTWVRDLPPGNDVPVVLVAGSGGGLRAAYWTAMSLAVLQDKIPAFGRHMFAFSGVSGGSLGGALFAALLHDSPPTAAPCTSRGQESPRAGANGTYASCVREFMRGDHLSPVLGKLLGPDFVQLLLPFPIRAFDRAEALEKSWEQSYEELGRGRTLSAPLLTLRRDPTAERSVPLLFLNATHVETGRRYIASTATYGEGDTRGPMPFPDSGDVHDKLQTDLPLSVAVHNSARFTYVSPAGHLDSSKGIELGHVVDGGYFENSGLATLRDIYDIVSRDQATDRRLTVYVLYLCNDPKGCGDRPDGAVESKLADELLSPARALLKTRDARGSLSRAALRGIATGRGSHLFLELNVCADLKPAADETQVRKARDRVISPPLGWLLSKQARDWLDESLVGGTAAQDPQNCYANNARTIDTLYQALKTGR